MTVHEAAQKLLRGALLVFPTETVYGLGALASNEKAIRKIFRVKGRPIHNPLILHIAEKRQLNELVQEIPSSAKILIDHFWPGPLTICFKKSKNVSDLVTAELPTVCIRQPSHPIAHRLLAMVNEPVAAPSANLSGKPSATTFRDAKRQLLKKGVYFLPGRKSPLGIESTVVDCSGRNLRLLRPGVITKHTLESVIGKKIEDSSKGKKVRSPGQLLRHYSPSGKLMVLFGTREKRRKYLSQHHFDKKERWAFGLIGKKMKFVLPGTIFFIASSEQNLNTYASRLYRFLNNCDRAKAKHIVLELPKTKHPLLPTLVNRLEKASRGRIRAL